VDGVSNPIVNQSLPLGDRARMEERKKMTEREQARVIVSSLPAVED